MKFPSAFRGATLLELVIILVIIAILTVIAFVNTAKSIGKSRKAEAMTVLKGIYQFELGYYYEKGFFVYTSDDTTFDLPGWNKPLPKAHWWFGVVPSFIGDSAVGFIAVATEKTDADLDGIGREKLTLDEKGIFRELQK